MSTCHSHSSIYIVQKIRCFEILAFDSEIFELALYTTDSVAAGFTDEQKN